MEEIFEDKCRTKIDWISDYCHFIFSYYYKIMSGGSSAPAKCVPIRDFCSATNIKSMLRGFIYAYDTPRNITVRPILRKNQIKTDTWGFDVFQWQLYAVLFNFLLYYMVYVCWCLREDIKATVNQLCQLFNLKLK